MNRQLINDLYKYLAEEGKFCDMKGIGSSHYTVSGPKITDCNALKLQIFEGRITIESFQKKDRYKLPSPYVSESDRSFEISYWGDSIPGLNVQPMSGIKKEVLEFMKIYGYHFCETLYPEDTNPEDSEYDKEEGYWHGADGEEERFLAYNPYEKNRSDQYRDFYIKKN